MFLNDLFTEAKRPVKQGSINDYPVPKKLHKGVDKIYARVLQRQVDRENGEHVPNVDEQVAVIVAAHPKLLSYGIFKRVGRSGMCHIKLLGGKLKDWAAGDMIAVSPDEVYATWDPYLDGKTAVHRAYNDAGQSTVREGPEEKYAKDPSGHMRNMYTNRLEGPSGFDTSPSSEEYYRQRREAKRAKARAYRAKKKAETQAPIKEATGLKKRVKIVKGPAAGKTGYVGEVHHGLFKGAPKQFVIDLDGGGNVKCSKDELRLIKDAPIEEGNHPTYGGEEANYAVTYDIYGNNREKPLYTNTRNVHASSPEEAERVLRKLVGGTNYRVVQMQD